MFSNTARTGFGGNPTFGSPAQANPFGGTTQMFGATPSAFGTPSFTQPATNVFGQQQQQPQNQLFSSANTSTFGAAPQNAFGSSSLFSQQTPSSTTSLFGSGSTFGQQNKQPGYSFPTPQTSIFGQNQPQQQPTNVFQSSTSSNIFGGSTGGFGMAAPTGTTVKFQPVTGTDSMQKSGATTVINTKHHCITCMKEYENKSFEELRLEDYAANRKGPQAGSQPGGFGAPTTGGLTAQPFGATSTTGMFGQTTDPNKSAFGQTNAFGTPAPAFGANTNTSSGSIFGKPAFGSPITSTAGTGFGTFGGGVAQPSSTTSLFGGQQNKPFGQSAPLFGSTQPQQNAFGSTSFFGQNTAATQAQSSFFSKPAQPTFSTPQSGGFMFGQQPASTAQTTGLFQQPKTSGFSLFNTTTTTATAPSAWPSANTFGNNAFAKPAQPAFGTGAQSGFGTSLQMPQNNLFSGLGNKPMFGNQPSTNLFGNTSVQSTPSFGLQQNTQQPVTLNASSQLNDLRAMIANSDPYGYSPHLDNLEGFKPSGTSGGTHYVTNPKDIDNYLKATENNIASTGPKPKKIQVKSPGVMEKWKLFESSYDVDETDSSGHGQPINKSIKRLTIRRDSNLKKPEPIYVVKDGRLIENNADENNSNNSMGISSPARALQLTQSLENVPTPEKTSTPPRNLRSTPEISRKPIPTAKDTTYTLSADIHQESSPVSNLNTNNNGNNNGNLQPTSSQRNVGVVNIDTLGDVTQQKSQSSTDIVDTCGVICTRPQYYTIPSLDKLPQFKNPDGTCFIEGFTIGRHGYGNVHFPDVMNVANLNIDQLVHFCHKQICIYVDDSTKPPVGEGLNRPAQVTLDRVYPSKHPKSRKSGSTSTEEDDGNDTTENNDTEDPQARAMAEIEFEEVLRRACARAGTTFVDYRPETGSWVFKVPHFSKYDLLETEEEEIRKEALQKRKTVEKSTNSIEIVEQNQNEIETSDLNGKRQSNVDVTSKVPKGLGGFAPIEPEAEPKTSAFYADSAVHLRPFTPPQRNLSMEEHWDQDRIPKRNMQLMQMKYMFFSEEDKAGNILDVEMEGMQDLSDQTSPDQSMSELDIRSTTHRERDAYEMFVLHNLHKRIPMEKSLLINRVVMDAAAFKGRSFKCGWGSGHKMFVLADGTANRIAEMRISEVANNIEEEPSPDPFINHDILTSFICLIYKETTLQLEHDILGETIPFFEMLQSSDDRYQSSDDSLLLRLFKLSEQFSLKHSRNEHMAYYHSIWKLMVAFWDNPSDCDLQTHPVHYRREMFNEWLEHVTSSTVNQILSDQNSKPTPENILTCLTGHKIRDAVTMASTPINGKGMGYPQLTLLISQLNSPNLTRYYIQQQLNYWQTTGALDHITNDMRKLYMLFAGMVTYGDVNVLEGLDWLRCVAIYFWYICPSWRSIQGSMATYEEAFENNGHAAPPVSRYATLQDTWDILFYIMKLYYNNQSSLQILLSPQTHTSDPNDYRLSWLLQQVFLSMGIGKISDECHYHTTTSFASQLEDFQLYKWCIFVLLHIKDTVVRKNLIMQVLDRQLVSIDSDLEEHLVTNFHIPSTWLHEVRAAQTKLLGMHWQAYKHLCYSGQFCDSHELLIKELVPTLVGNHEFDTLNCLLEELESERLQIVRWRYQGGLIMQFIHFWRAMRHFQERNNVPASEVTAIQSQLNQLLTHLRSYTAADYKQVMVVAEMSKFCASFYTTLMKHDVCELNNQLNLVVMPFDYKYAEINKFIGHSKKALRGMEL